MTHNVCALMRVRLTGVAARVVSSEEHGSARIGTIVAHRHSHSLVSAVRASQLAVSQGGSDQPAGNLNGLTNGNVKAGWHDLDNKQLFN